MYKKPEKGITDQEYETTDKDMAKLLAILQNVPEAEIPERFEQRFRDALKIEGDKIREEKRIAAAEKKRGWYRRYMKAAAAAAACFVVVFASVSMYNDGIGSLPEQSRSLESSGKTDILAVESSVAPQEGENRKDLGSHEEDIAQDQGLNRYDLHSAAVMSGAAGNVASPRAGFDATEPNPEESGINYSAEITEADTLCREGGKFVETTEEGYLTYRKLVDEYLTGYEFEYVTYKKDHSTGVYLFELRILKDPEGRIVDAPLILIGEQGEIHEQQTEQQSTDSEPVSGGERSAEDGQDSQKPQDDSD